MCNLYTLSTNQDAIRRLFRVTRDLFGNLPPALEVYPDRAAPVVRLGEGGEREIAPLVWGMPSPSFALKGKPDPGVTNIRNTSSAHWRTWLGPEHRCIIPWTRFCEWETAGSRKVQRWFSCHAETAVFAGIWTRWTGTRGTMRTPRPGTYELFGMLTTEPNAIARPVHPKAMPVILTRPDEIEEWLHAPWEEAKRLQRPLDDSLLRLMPLAPAAQPSLFD